jgi:hypothetical protein
VSLWFLHDGGGDKIKASHKLIDKSEWFHDWYICMHAHGGGINLPVGAVRCMFYDQTGGKTATGIGDGTYDNTDKEWHHVVVKKDGENAEFWLDGVMSQSTTSARTVRNSNPLVIGNSMSGDPNQRIGWSGMIDEIMIFDRPLTGEEIQNYYKEGMLKHPVRSRTTNLPTRELREYQKTPFPLDGAVRIKPLQIDSVDSKDGKHAALVFERLESGVPYRLSFDWLPEDGETINLNGVAMLYDMGGNVIAQLEIDQPRARVSTLGAMRFNSNFQVPSEPAVLRVEGDLAKYVTPKRNWVLTHSTVKTQWRKTEKNLSR